MKINKLFVYLLLILMSPFAVLQFLIFMVSWFGMTLPLAPADIVGTSLVCWIVGIFILIMTGSLHTLSYFTIPISVKVSKKKD